MSWVIVGAACGAIASGAVTLAVMAETEPYINNDGEEEYTLSGYLLLAGAHVIKWIIRKTIKAFQNNPMPSTTTVEDEEKIEIVESENEFELVV